MTRSDQVYSRLIAWLKILLPLGALGLLSTMFLFSRSADPILTVPLLENGVDPTQSEQVSVPFFAGTTEAGHSLTLAARQARADDTETDMMVADDLQAVIDVEEGNRIVIDATAAKYRDGDGRLLLEGGVNISSSTGYTMRTEGLDASIDTLELESTDRVEAEGPGVTLTAGKLSVTEDNATNDIQLLFTGGVKLIYTPETSEGEE